MEKNGLLSVIVPVYKVESYLKRCVDSIRAQTYKNLQIILVDDGSPDACGEICDAYTKMDPRIMAVHQQNEGLSGARNNGLLFAKGEYVAFVDSDDWLQPEMYETLIRLIRQHDLDMARCSAIETDGIQEKKILPHTGNANCLFTGSKIFELYFSEFLCKIVWNTVYRREIVNDILSPENCHSQDNYVSGRYLYRAQRMMLIDRCLYNYFRNPTSITHGGHKRLLDICLCTQKLKDDLRKEEGMKNSNFERKLDRKLARELFHFIRSNQPQYRICAIERCQKKFISKNLDFLRRIRFHWLLQKKHIHTVL